MIICRKIDPEFYKMAEYGQPGGAPPPLGGVGGLPGRISETFFKISFDFTWPHHDLKNGPRQRPPANNIKNIFYIEYIENGKMVVQA